MVYQGSKRRIAPEIIPIILKDRKPDQWYVEPFVGGCNSIIQVDGNRIGNDINPFLISMLRAVQNDWEPPDFISEELYQKAKYDNHAFHSWLVGYIGICCSFGTKWFGGYARKKNHRDYFLERKKDLLRDRLAIKNVYFYCGNFYRLYIPDKSIIYCDPPYKNTAGYKQDFDQNLFWLWVRDMTKKGHRVFISENEAPDDFECLWEKKIKYTTAVGKPKESVERLFRWNGRK